MSLIVFLQETKLSLWWLTEAFDFSDGGSLTWNEPPPTQIVQAVGNPVHHYSSRQLHEGTINANLSWQFDLTELKFKTLILLFNGTILGGVTSSGQGLVAGFKNQFGFDWILNQTFVRLIIFNVTIKENGTFTCRVRVRVDTGQGFGAHFDSNVQVNVVGKLKVGTYIYIYRERERERERERGRERERILHGHAWICCRSFWSLG